MVKTEDSNKVVGSVMIVGAGISGMQAALDLADSGYKVYIVEKSSSIGGKMPMLDKTFPTNDCSMCIVSPKLVDCGRHHNIEILTLTEVTGVKGESGNFTVSLLKHARYVDPEKCMSCGSCEEECPISVPAEFNQYLDERKAIYKLYPQALPNTYTIDKENCIECGMCEDACPVDAIDHEMEDNEMKLNVGAIIVCPGYELFNPELRGEFGWGVYDNVLTSLQFERMLSASGPSQGHVETANGNTPEKIAFIQCVGSRDFSLERCYCSSVCCMYATKEAMIAQEHLPGVETSIFCMDVRAYGKDYEKYYERARNEYGVKYIKSMISSVKEVPDKRLRVRYRLTEGEILEEDFDIVVLSTGLKPTDESIELAKNLGIELNHYDFCNTTQLSGVQSSVKGIYVAGAFNSPKDIPETVMEATAAAGECAADLSSARNSEIVEKEFPPEKEVRDEEPRIGVYVCHCGINIASVVDIDSVVSYAENLPGVVHVTNKLYACSQDSQNAIREDIEKHNLNRVVVASCSPRTHKPLFQDTIRDAGLNPYLFEMANIRDQCSWVHANEPVKATEKADDLVKAAVAKSSYLSPVKTSTLKVTPESLVIGGGISGMNSALGIAEQGFKVHLVEKSTGLGGVARRISEGFDGEDIQAYLNKLINDVTNHPLIDVYTEEEIIEVSGYKGQFASKLSSGKVINYGTAIIATGAEEAKPSEYYYGEDSRVLTQLELDEAIAKRKDEVLRAQNVIMIQCVGSREDDCPYCSRICCTKTMKLSLKLKELNPDVNIIVLYRDIRTYGFFEDYYREAREKGVLFFRYDLDNKPDVSLQENKLTVTAVDHVLNEEISINSDLLVLASPVIPREDNSYLSQLFKVSLNSDKFFQEAHMKLRPVDFSSEGIFMCGMAHSPKSIEESISQGKAAAGRAGTILSKETIESSGVIATVDIDKCAACLTCIRLCPFKAPRIAPGNYAVEIEPAICQGCGTCAGECPNKAITLVSYSDDILDTAVDAFFDGK